MITRIQKYIRENYEGECKHHTNQATINLNEMNEIFLRRCVSVFTVLTGFARLVCICFANSLKASGGSWFILNHTSLVLMALVEIK